MKPTYKIWLSPPHLGDNEVNYITQAVKSNWLTTSGAFVDNFEEQLESHLGQKRFVTVLNSGTSAIHLALLQLKVTKNDEVLCQSFTFCGSVNPVLYLGATPIFIGSESKTFNMCPNSLEEAIKSRVKKGRKPKAIIIVHLYGMPAKMDELLKISQLYDIPIIEDAAEAIGSKYKSINCGNFGDYGIFSFNGNKVITSSGGGALISKTRDTKLEIIHLATQAKDEAPHYEHSKVGYNYRLSNLLAAVGVAQLENLETRLLQLKNNHEFYSRLFKDSEFIKLHQNPSKDFESNHWLNCISISEKAKFNANTVINHLKKHHIESKPLWKPMHLQPIYSTYLYFGNNIESQLFNTGLCLPSGSDLTLDNKQVISEALKLFI